LYIQKPCGANLGETNMLIIVVTENVDDVAKAGEVKAIIKKELPLYDHPSVPVGVASEEDVRQEDIVGLIHWQARREEANNDHV
jgi:hypothetical protein